VTRWNWRRCLGHIIVVPPKVLLVGRQSSGPRPRLGLGERGLDCWFSFRLVKRGCHQEIAATAIVGVPSFASLTCIAAEAMSAVVIVSTGERAEGPIARPYGAGRRCHRSNRSAGHCRDDRVEMTTPSSVTGMKRLRKRKTAAGDPAAEVRWMRPEGTLSCTFQLEQGERCETIVISTRARHARRPKCS